MRVSREKRKTASQYVVDGVLKEVTKSGKYAFTAFYYPMIDWFIAC
jgi:hypothetical protein